MRPPGAESEPAAPASVAFDRAAAFYDDTRGFPPGEEEGVAACIAAAGGLTADGRVLEVGIGTGRVALPLARRVGAVCGVDIARQMMARLRAKRSGEAVHPVQADAARLPFPARSFDAAVAVHVFHLIPNWPAVLHEVARVLRPGAPLLSGWSNTEAPPGLEAVFQRRSLRPAVGVAHERRETFLDEAGWQPVSEVHTHAYTVQQAPQALVERLKRRVWSGTWRLTDAELAEVIAATEALIAAHVDDPTVPVTLTARFSVRAYLPPRT